MGDLEALLPKKSPTVEAIYAYHKAKGDAEPQRGYLGASIVGHECDYFLWATFRGAIREDMPGRIYRLLETGDVEEARFVAELRAIGCEVHDRDEKGEQFAVSALGGHFSGHMDGVVTGLLEAPKTPHLLETKTANEKHFSKIEKEGVKKAKPQHYAQMQAYMGLMDLTRAFYLVKGKNDDDLYSERVEFDRAFFDHLMRRSKRIIESSQAPEKIAKRADDYRCKFCPGHALCWGGEVAVPIKGGQSCRTCVHATAETGQPGATWSCAKFATRLESTDVGAECPAHLLLPGFVSFADATDSDDDWIEFTSRDGTKWRHGLAPSQFTTKVLMAARGPLDPPSLTVTNGGSYLEGCPSCEAVDEGSIPYTPHSRHVEADLLAVNFVDAKKREHVPWECDEADCKRPWCAKHEFTLFLCRVCHQGEDELEPECPGKPDPRFVDAFEPGRE